MPINRISSSFTESNHLPSKQINNLANSVEKAITPAYAYLRVSGKGQIVGDGFPRQAAAIHSYADRLGFSILETFREEGVSGATELDNRPALARLLAAVNNGTVLTVLIEKLDRLARDLMIQETIIADLRKRGIRLISAGEPDLLNTDPTRTLMRQILGAVAQYDKAMIVAKLRVARERRKISSGSCEGRKPYGFFAGEKQPLALMCSMQLQGFSLSRIATELESLGIHPRSGSRWDAKTISRIVQRQLNSHQVLDRYQLVE
jgi:DNA invertase Pin-like site-specific DNA recombinase